MLFSWLTYMLLLPYCGKCCYCTWCCCYHVVAGVVTPPDAVPCCGRCCYCIWRCYCVVAGVVTASDAVTALWLCCCGTWCCCCFTEGVVIATDALPCCGRCCYCIGGFYHIVAVLLWHLMLLLFYGRCCFCTWCCWCYCYDVQIVVEILLTFPVFSLMMLSRLATINHLSWILFQMSSPTNWS